MSSQLKTPVAFIIFNRPKCTQRVFAEIRKAQPEKLYLIADDLSLTSKVKQESGHKHAKPLQMQVARFDANSLIPEFCFYRERSPCVRHGGLL